MFAIGTIGKSITTVFSRHTRICTSRGTAAFSSSHHGFIPRSRRQTRRTRRAVKKACSSSSSSSSSSTSTVLPAAVDYEDDVPSLATVKSMPVTLREMDNTALTTLGAMGNYMALQEMIKRHIMATDNVSYKQASTIYTKIEKKNHEYENYMAFPFQASILTCFTVGCISVPLVFHLPTVEFFNEYFVTADHPPPKDLETALEVGSWSWNWMEPVLGTSTFLLLTLQYMRMHLQHLGVNPYTVRLKRMRGRHLADAFPQYNEELLIAYSESAPFYNSKDLWF